MNENGSPYQWWVIPIGIALTCLSILFIPFLFFYHSKSPWIGRASRTRQDATLISPPEAVPVSSSQQQPSNKNESGDRVDQSSSSFGVGDSILLNPLLPASSGQLQSDRISRSSRKSVTINENVVHHKQVGDRIETTTLTITPPLESTRQRLSSGSQSHQAPK